MLKYVKLISISLVISSCIMGVNYLVSYLGQAYTFFDVENIFDVCVYMYDEFWFNAKRRKRGLLTIVSSPFFH